MSFRMRTPRASGNRRTLLAQRWKDMQGRCRGHSTKSPWCWAGLTVGWRTFAEFRAYALANGFTKVNNSPERRDATRGYVPGNVVFVTRQENSSTSRGAAYYGYSDYAVRGAEPPLDDYVPF